MASIVEETSPIEQFYSFYRGSPFI